MTDQLVQSSLTYTWRFTHQSLNWKVLSIPCASISVLMSEYFALEGLLPERCTWAMCALRVAGDLQAIEQRKLAKVTWTEVGY